MTLHAKMAMPDFSKSTLLEIQRIETATYSNKAYFAGELYIFCEIKRFCKTLL